MNAILPTRLAIAAAVSLCLAGCIDAGVEVDLTSSTTARTVVTQTMGADFHAMLAMNATAEPDAEAAQQPSMGGFCGTGELTENADGSLTCVVEAEGEFAALMRAGGQPIRFTAEADGAVRVELALADVRAAIGAGETDEEGQQMLEAFFAGRKLTVDFAGATVTDSNMEISADGRSAEAVIPLLDIINETGDWPEELYAVVEAP